ncbi:MAG: DUF559 domain-containing protein [Gammaproteobacteria bacterium]|nr:DUF559 domain-containing protein [Gammaproteobacteria bacterium]
MKQYARSLRRDATLAESRLWHFLRDRRLLKYKFVRQYVIDSYIADFVCRQKKLIIELDGSQHMDNIAYDQKRTNHLIKQGYTVLRVWNNDIFENIEVVLEHILQLLDTP